MPATYKAAVSPPPVAPRAIVVPPPLPACATPPRSAACCLSINPSPAFAPFDVPLPDIHGIYRVLACIIFH